MTHKTAIQARFRRQRAVEEVIAKALQRSGIEHYRIDAWQIGKLTEHILEAVDKGEIAAIPADIPSAGT